jgi:hypothetical protein
VTIAIPVLLGLVLAVLVFIAYELRTLVRASRHITEFPAEERESHEHASTGQTINVNLAPLAPITHIAPSITTAPPPEPLPDSAVDEKKEEESKKREREKEEMPAAKIVSGNQFVVKCPHCQAENSRFRSECFNCGQPL